MAVPGDSIIPLDTSAVGKDAAKPAELEDPERLSRTVFVGNVPAITKRKELKRLFKSFGPVEAVRLRGVVAANPKLPKKTALLARRMHKDCDTCLAYVVFKREGSAASLDDSGDDDAGGAAVEPKETAAVEVSPEPVDYTKPTATVKAACAALNLTILHEKHLRVNPALHTRGPLRQSIFLGNLPFDVTEEELIVLFQETAKEAGCNLTGVRVTRDKETGMGRGVGFVSFDDDLGVRAAMHQAGSLELRGRVVRMERAAKEKKRNSKTYKRNAKLEAKREQTRLSGQTRGKAKGDKRKRDERTGERLTRKIKKERSEKKFGKKVKHAARKARQAEAAAGGVAAGSGQ